MKITKFALKEKIIEDCNKIKEVIDRFYLEEIERVIDYRVDTYNRITKEGLEQELKLHLIGFMRDFIYSDINEKKFIEKIGELLK